MKKFTITILFFIVLLSCSKRNELCNNIPEEKYQVLKIDTARMAVGPYSDTINVPLLSLKDNQCKVLVEARLIEWETLSIGDLINKK